MIQITQLKKHFGDKTAVDVSDLYIRRGEIIGLVGNNGAGKTTFFRLMLDLLKADEGSVKFVMPAEECLPGESPIEEIDPAISERWKQFVGAYLDEGFLIDFLTPFEYFCFISQTLGLNAEETQQRIESFAGFLDWQPLEEKKLIRDFSAGNKQKIGIIAAMLGRPQLLILDEPFNFLDPSSQHMLEQLLRSYCNETGATLLLSSHNLQHTIGVSSRIVLLEKGNIIKDLPNDNGNAEAELENYFCGQ